MADGSPDGIKDGFLGHYVERLAAGDTGAVASLFVRAAGVLARAARRARRAPTSVPVRPPAAGRSPGCHSRAGLGREHALDFFLSLVPR